MYKTINGIDKMEYISDGDLARLYCIFSTENDEIKYECNFYNVTNMKINMTGGKVVIEGFDITDHKKDGWLSENRYYVYDYESDSISFYCEDFCFTER